MIQELLSLPFVVSFLNTVLLELDVSRTDIYLTTKLLRERCYCQSNVVNTCFNTVELEYYVSLY